MRFQLRTLAPTEETAILTLANWFYEEWGTPVEQTIHKLKHPHKEGVLGQWVAEDGDEIVATARLCTNPNLLKLAAYAQLKIYKYWISAVYVKENYRGKGFGKILMEEVALQAKSIGADALYLYTYSPIAQSLYKKCGWYDMEIVQYKGYECVLMGKVL